MRGAWIEIRVIARAMANRASSLPVRGAWIEMILSRFRVALARRRSPCGERGLKFATYWETLKGTSRSPCGERGLKSFRPLMLVVCAGRSPCGERGLKCNNSISSKQ